MATSEPALRRHFAGRERARVVLEVGSHSLRSTKSFATKVADALPEELAPALVPVLETIAGQLRITK